jgi:hypothetical protein
VGTEATALTVAGVGAYNDFRNNVFYNWLGTAGTGASGQASQNNFINNFYLAGPGGDNPVGGTSTAITTSVGGTAIFNGSDATLTKVFHAGNLKDTNRDGDASDGVALANGDFGSSAFQAAAFTQTPYYGVTAAAAAGYADVLDHAGARWWSRAAVDARIVNETRTGTGKIVAWADDPFDDSATEGTEWRALRATPLTARPAGFDSDGDGMPDAWETMHGLNPAVADNNGDFDNDGYTNLEEYLNEIAAWPALAAVMFDGARGTRYADIFNWTLDPRADASPGPAGARRTPRAAHWQPSRHDVARIARGTAVVDAVGQHAGTLQVAAEAPARAAALRVTGGWLDVARRLEIGGGGAVALAGGRLVTPALVKAGAGGAFDFTGGTLQAGRVGFDLVDRGGTVAPGPLAGSPIGRTDVQGSLTIAAGALAIDVDRAAADLVTVAGTAHLGGALDIRPVAGFAPRPGASWTILTARRGVRGRFASVTPGYSVRVARARVVVTYDGRGALTASEAPAPARNASVRPGRSS